MQENDDLIPGLERSPAEGNSNSIQYSCLENPMERSLAGYSLWSGKEGPTFGWLILQLSSLQPHKAVKTSVQLLNALFCLSANGPRKRWL